MRLHSEKKISHSNTIHVRAHKLDISCLYIDDSESKHIERTHNVRPDIACPYTWQCASKATSSEDTTWSAYNSQLDICLHDVAEEDAAAVASKDVDVAGVSRDPPLSTDPKKDVLSYRSISLSVLSSRAVVRPQLD